MNLDQGYRLVALAEERVRLLERLADIDRQIACEMAPSTTAAVTCRTSASGCRPVAKVDKGRGVNVHQTDLPTVLAQIAARSKPLALADFVALSRQAGYVSEAKDYPNMVYQALLKLVKKGVLRKDADSRAYTFIGEAAES